jgi:cell division protease FtsH
MKLLRLCFLVSAFALFFAHQPAMAKRHNQFDKFEQMFQRIRRHMMRNFHNNMKFFNFPEDFFITPNEPNNIEITIIKGRQQPQQPQQVQLPEKPQLPQQPIKGFQTQYPNVWSLLGENQGSNRNQYGKDGSINRYHQYNPNTTKKITFDDVKGQSEAITEISEVVDFLKNPKNYQRLGAEIPRGILLEGPPGCGKTLLAKAAAHEAGCAFIYACGSHFINKYVGTGADNVRKLFAQARAQAPAIVFIDEIDALKARKGDTNEEYHHTLNALLDQLDGFQKNDNIIVIAATNFSKALDPALVRPGRFDRIINVGLPTRQGREEILRLYAKKVLLDPTINLDKLVTEFSQRTTGFSGAELKKLVNEAALSACRHKSPNVTLKHFEEAYDKITLGLVNNLDRTPEQLRRTSCHESGHTLIKVLTKQPIAKVSILSKGGALGVTFEKQLYESTSEYRKEELLNKIMALQGGYLAEKIMHNCSRPGASDDIKRAYEIASAMVKKFGMGKGELEGLRYSNDMSTPWKKKFDDEISSLLRECSANAEKLLCRNKNKLSALTEELLKKETLNEAEIQKVVSTA